MPDVIEMIREHLAKKRQDRQNIQADQKRESLTSANKVIKPANVPADNKPIKKDDLKKDDLKKEFPERGFVKKLVQNMEKSSKQ
jgi:hypothetical protein